MKAMTDMIKIVAIEKKIDLHKNTRSASQSDMSSPPQRKLTPLNKNASGDRDAPGEGRLATVDNAARGPPAPGVTRLGTQKMRFTPKAVGKKSTDECFANEVKLTLALHLQNPAL